MTEPARPFDRQPVLLGEDVQLLRTVAQDWAALYQVASDPLIWRDHPQSDRWREPVFHAYFADALASGGGLTIRDRATGAVIGATRYSTGRAGSGEVEIGWTFLARERWRTGANRQVKRLMVAHALRSFNAVLFFVGRYNTRSRRAVEALGALLLRGGQRPAAATDDYVIYRLDHPVP